MTSPSNRAEQLRLAGIKRFGTESKWRAHLAESAKKARRDTPRGFAVYKLKNPERFKELSSKGGKISKRTPKVMDYEDLHES